MKWQTTRRRFMTAAAAAGATAGTRLIDGPLVLAGPSPGAKLGTVVIGVGGRGAVHLDAAAAERLVAIADVDENRLAVALKLLASKHAVDTSKVKTFVDYRRMFDAVSKDVDAVFVCTPDHQHACASMTALQLGKHVYCEKPLTHDIHEARALAEAARRAKVATQMGNQGHSGEGYRRVCEYLWAGAIGKVKETYSWNGCVNGRAGPRPPTRPVPNGLHWDEWIGPSPYREFHDGLHPLYWRYWRDFGTGGLGDWGCHNLDGVFWALKLGHPTSIECLEHFGGGNESYPTGSAIRWNFPARGDMPAAAIHWYDGTRPAGDGNPPDPKGGASKTAPNAPPLAADYEKKTKRRFDQTFGGGGTLYLGDKGAMVSGNYGNDPRLLPDEAHQAFTPPPLTIPRVKSHMDDFLRGCKGGPAPCSNFEVAAALTEFVLLGHLALFAGPGAKVEWDGPAMKVTNRPELNRYVKREYRKGWTL